MPASLVELNNMLNFLKEASFITAGAIPSIGDDDIRSYSYVDALDNNKIKMMFFDKNERRNDFIIERDTLEAERNALLDPFNKIYKDKYVNEYNDPTDINQPGYFYFIQKELSLNIGNGMPLYLNRLDHNFNHIGYKPEEHLVELKNEVNVVVAEVKRQYNNINEDFIRQVFLARTMVWRSYEMTNLTLDDIKQIFFDQDDHTAQPQKDVIDALYRQTRDIAEQYRLLFNVRANEEIPKLLKSLKKQNGLNERQLAVAIKRPITVQEFVGGAMKTGIIQEYDGYDRKDQLLNKSPRLFLQICYAALEEAVIVNNQIIAPFDQEDDITEIFQDDNEDFWENANKLNDQPFKVDAKQQLLRFREGRLNGLLSPHELQLLNQFGCNQPALRQAVPVAPVVLPHNVAQPIPVGPLVVDNQAEILIAQGCINDIVANAREFVNNKKPGYFDGMQDINVAMPIANVLEKISPMALLPQGVQFNAAEAAHFDNMLEKLELLENWFDNMRQNFGIAHQPMIDIGNELKQRLIDNIIRPEQQRLAQEAAAPPIAVQPPVAAQQAVNNALNLQLEALRRQQEEAAATNQFGTIEAAFRVLIRNQACFNAVQNIAPNTPINDVLNRISQNIIPDQQLANIPGGLQQFDNVVANVATLRGVFNRYQAFFGQAHQPIMDGIQNTFKQNLITIINNERQRLAQEAAARQQADALRLQQEAAARQQADALRLQQEAQPVEPGPVLLGVARMRRR